MKKLHVICLILIAFLVSCGDKEPVTEKPKRKIFVSTSESKMMVFEDRESAQGTIEGLIDPTVAAEISGKVIKLHARSGSAVSKGDLLAEIDNRDYLYQKNLAEADGSRDNLPPPADAPEQFGLGIKREQPKHY